MSTELRILVGIPASGKSTVVQAWLHNREVNSVISSDAIRKEITGSMEDFTQEPLVWETIYLRVEASLSAGNATAVDATNVTVKGRAPWIALGLRYGVVPQAYVVYIELNDALQRNATRDRVVPDYVMHTMHKNFEQNCSKGQLENEGFSVVTEAPGTAELQIEA
jgi:predicted kinase